MLGSGFWLIVSERFDPRTAKSEFGPIAGAGTLGGLAGGLLAARVAAQFDTVTMLPIMAVLTLLCAWLVRRLAVPKQGASQALPVDIAPELTAMPDSGFRLLHETPYLRSLAVLVPAGPGWRGPHRARVQSRGSLPARPRRPPLRFFAIYYAAISLLTFIVQILFSRVALQRLGPRGQRRHTRGGPARR
jgi:hypothetical protein